MLAKVISNKLKTIVLAFVFAIGVSTTATAGEAEAAPAAPAADPADVESIDAIMAAVYDVISGPAGEARDWDRFRSLFIDGARLIPVSPDGATVLSTEDFIERVKDNFVDDGFVEIEIGRKAERYGDIVHLFSAYEGRRKADDAEPFLRGINSFQLLHHDNRWWVVTIYWQPENEDRPIPEEYLKQE